MPVTRQEKSLIAILLSVLHAKTMEIILVSLGIEQPHFVAHFLSLALVVVLSDTFVLKHGLNEDNFSSMKLKIYIFKTN